MITEFIPSETWWLMVRPISEEPAPAWVSPNTAGLSVERLATRRTRAKGSRDRSALRPTPHGRECTECYRIEVSGEGEFRSGLEEGVGGG